MPPENINTAVGVPLERSEDQGILLKHMSQLNQRLLGPWENADGQRLPHGHLGASSFVFTTEGVLKLCGLGEPAWLAASLPADAEPSVAGDLRALGRVAAGWAALTGPRRDGKSRPLPGPLQAVLGRLQAEAEGDRYPDCAALLEDLDRAGAGVPANAAAWERFVRSIRDQSADTPLRRSV